MKQAPKYLKLLTLIFISLLSQLAYAQPEYEKRQKANKENEEHLKRVYENNLPNKKTSTIGTTLPTNSPSSGSSIYVSDHQRKMDYYNNKEKARSDAWEEKERRFNILSADVAKTEANYYKLISLAEQAGFDYYDAMRMNGRYAPKIIELPVLVPYKQQQFDNYIKQTADYREKKEWKSAVDAMQEAIKISDDPKLRDKLAYIYRTYLYDYDNAARQYYYIQQSAISNKPDMRYVYMDWGEVSILGGDYANAVRCFTDLPARLYDGDASINQSYAYFLAGNLEKARSVLLENYTYEHYINTASLIKNYYMIRQGNSDAAQTLLLKNKEKEANITYTGDLKRDLSLILLKKAKTTRSESDLTICYLLDLAADLDPSNTDITETRYDYNANIKRVSFDAGMSPELVLKLSEGKSARALKKENMINKGYMILWFGKGDKALIYAGSKVRMSADISEEKVIEHLVKEVMSKEIYKNYSYISNTFLKNATEEDAYNEIGKKLKIKPEKAKAYKYGYLYSSYTYEFYK